MFNNPIPSNQLNTNLPPYAIFNKKFQEFVPVNLKITESAQYILLTYQSLEEFQGKLDRKASLLETIHDPECNPQVKEAALKALGQAIQSIPPQSSQPILPEEILLYTFNFLDGADLKKAKVVCKDWNRIGKDSTLIVQQNCEKIRQSLATIIGSLFSVASQSPHGFSFTIWLDEKGVVQGVGNKYTDGKLESEIKAAEDLFQRMKGLKTQKKFEKIRLNTFPQKWVPAKNAAFIRSGKEKISENNEAILTQVLEKLNHLAKGAYVLGKFYEYTDKETGEKTITELPEFMNNWYSHMHKDSIDQLSKAAEKFTP